ncbi:transposase [Methanobrevibacter sp. DSM 116169]|uniref:helix-turn-helix domain-containing protein n=1 Tax=Methanobrevibacter sp. DSM 116169 TaxID=3242727 RepID=UPI0038FCDB40
MSRKAFLNKDHASVEEIQNRIKRLEQDIKVLNKLYFINDIYHDYSVSETCEKLGITNPTGLKWLKTWNKKGFDGLERKKGSGGQSKLSISEKEYLDEKILKNKFKSTKEVRQFIIDEFGVEYSIRQVERILKDLNFNYGKPYVLYSKMPDNAEDQLKKNYKM